jgi:hypothetical protein
MMKNPYLKRKQERSKECRGKLAEQKAAKRLSAHVHAGSGNIPGYKGDLTKEDFKMESKSTVAKSMRVELHWLRKIMKEAMDANQHPALLIQFTAADADALPAGSWVAIPEHLFKEMVEGG